MCGIAGFLFAHRETDAPGDVAIRMANRLRHRGPDDEGSWADEAAGAALGFRRLSIIDLSADGRQPMISSSGRYVVIHNGEIYNFIELREELTRGGARFRGGSDTEALLAAVEAWGLEAALGRFVGMFAFALWDRRERTLHLARDRMGEKPLYYGWAGRSFLFGSELKALRAHPDWEGEICADALALYMKRSCVPAPHSIYRGIRKLVPGAVLSVRAQDPPGRLPAPAAYWRMKDVVRKASSSRPARSDDEALDQLDGVLRRSARGMMRADVPLGALLSGGVDSSMVTALTQAQSGVPIRTFSVGFHAAGHDEAPRARAVARHLGTEHAELYAGPKEALEVVPRLPELYDEPFADSSQTPTFLVCALTREHVKVALSGDGGDELFGGYNRYFWAPRVWRSIRRLPRPLRKAMASALTRRGAGLAFAYEKMSPLLPGRFRVELAGEKLRKLGSVLDASGLDEMYERLIARREAPVRMDANPAREDALSADPELDRLHPVERMMYRDMTEYLPDDILVKVDRAAMGASLETRAPYLDHRVVEFAWSLPPEMKTRGGEGKWLLKRLLARYLPPALFERPKMGFGAPIGEWLRGALRDWAEELLRESRLAGEGFFHPKPIRDMWAEHLSGARDRQYHLWDVLMFQAWLDAQAR